MPQSMPPFQEARVLVVGDVMLDRYYHGSANRISPEAPVPVVRVSNQEDRPGGAGNVALNIAALGGAATLVGVVGKDATAEDLGARLSAAGVRCEFLVSQDKPTITKLRVISQHQQLLRMDFEQPFDAQDVADLQPRLESVLESAQVVIVSDYAKGALQDVPAIIRAARAAGKPVIVDPKGSDFEKYRGATLITPNLHEFETVVGHCILQP